MPIDHLVVEKRTKSCSDLLCLRSDIVRCGFAPMTKPQRLWRGAGVVVQEADIAGLVISDWPRRLFIRAPKDRAYAISAMFRLIADAARPSWNASNKRQLFRAVAMNALSYEDNAKNASAMIAAAARRSLYVEL